jgi:hypothetical protein
VASGSPSISTGVASERIGMVSLRGARPCYGGRARAQAPRTVIRRVVTDSRDGEAAPAARVPMLRVLRALGEWTRRLTFSLHGAVHHEDQFPRSEVRVR